MNTHEVRKRIIELIEEGSALDPSDSGEFRVWVENSHEALEPFSASQEQFDVFCGSSAHSKRMRAEIGLQVLMQTAARLED